MTTPPSSKRPDTRLFYLSWQETRQVLSATEPTQSGVTTFLQSAQFRLDHATSNPKCPVGGIKDGDVIKYTSTPRKSAPLFSNPRSITARSIEQLRSALRPYVEKKRTPSTPPHICVEVTTQADGAVTIRSRNPWNSRQPK